LQTTGCDTHWDSVPENTPRTDTDMSTLLYRRLHMKQQSNTNKSMPEFMYQRIPIIPVTDTDKLPNKQLDSQGTYECIRNTI